MAEQSLVDRLKNTRARQLAELGEGVEDTEIREIDISKLPKKRERKKKKPSEKRGVGDFDINAGARRIISGLEEELDFASTEEKRQNILGRIAAVRSTMIPE